MLKLSLIQIGKKRLAAKSNVDLDTVTRRVETYQMQMGL